MTRDRRRLLGAARYSRAVYLDALTPLDLQSGLPEGARILVTGGSGFIGTNVVSAYRKAGFEVVNADTAAPRNAEDSDLWRRVDITERSQVDELLAQVRPSHVLHLGARTDLRGRTVAEYGANVEGVSILLDALRSADRPAERIIVASSRLVCRIGYRPTSGEDYCPTTPYGASKVETERLVRRADDLPWVMGRPTSIWGPWFDIPYRDFFLNLSRGRYVHPRGLRIPKHFGFVGNTIWQLHRLMTAPSSAVLHRLFYLADDPPIEVWDFANRVSAAVGRPPPREVPLPLMRALARTGDVFGRATGKAAPLTSFRLDNLLTPMLYDLDNTMRLAGPLPYTTEISIPETVRWLRSAGLV